jgi:hypothetical protein
MLSYNHYVFYNGCPHSGAQLRGIYKAVSVTSPNKLPEAANDGQCFWVVGTHCCHTHA